MLDQELPLVSCLCVTENRVNQLKRSISCFKAQTYYNKELIIVYKDYDVETEEFLKGFKESNVYSFKADKSLLMTLGDLRNLSIHYSKGEYFCNWDDDDWYHTNRLEVQIDNAINNFHPVTVLSNYILYDQNVEQAYFSDLNLWAGSILCKKSINGCDTSYPSQSKSEDDSLMDKLLKNSRIYPVISPNLYIYIYHGNNTWDKSHFQNIFSKSQKLSSSLSLLIKDIVDGKYTVLEGSALLNSAKVMEEINYFYHLRETLGDR